MFQADSTHRDIPLEMDLVLDFTLSDSVAATSAGRTHGTRRRRADPM